MKYSTLIFVCFVILSCTQTVQHVEVVRHDYPMEENLSLEESRAAKAKSSGVWVVEKGDTIDFISSKTGVPKQRILILNELDSPQDIYKGMKLRISNKVDFDNKTVRSIEIPKVAVEKKDLELPKELGSGVKNQGKISLPPEEERIELPQKINYAPEKNPDVPQPVFKPLAKLSDATTLSDAGESVIHNDGFIWPVKGKIISGYGAKKDGIYNDGINISAKEGAKVRAAKDGKVIYAGNELKNYGKLVIIKHGNELVTSYAHNKKLHVKKGDTVEQGEVIALVGKTGDVKTPQLHFTLRKGKDAQNPRDYLK